MDGNLDDNTRWTDPVSLGTHPDATGYSHTFVGTEDPDDQATQDIEVARTYVAGFNAGMKQTEYQSQNYEHKEQYRNGYKAGLIEWFKQPDTGETITTPDLTPSSDPYTNLHNAFWTDDDDALLIFAVRQALNRVNDEYVHNKHTDWYTRRYIMIRFSDYLKNELHDAADKL